MGKLRSSSVQGHSRTRPAWHRTKSWDLTTTAVKGSLRKTHLGSHKLLETMWQCHLSAGAAGTFRMRQLLQKNHPEMWMEVGKKINAERNSKDLINLMAIKPQRFSLGKHQLSVTGTRDKLPTSHLAKGKRWGVHCWQENLTLPHLVQQSE